MIARPRMVLTTSIALLAISLAGCGSGDSGSSDSGGAKGTFKAPETVKVDVGLDKPITIKKGSPLRVAQFGGTGNAWLNALNTNAKKTIEDAGGTLSLLASQGDAQKQADQMASAVSSGDYDAFILTAWDSDLLCNSAKKAADAGIIVALTPNPICGRELKEWGPDTYSPGTLTLTDAEQSVTYKRGWVQAINDKLPADSKVAIVVGPETDTLARTMKQAVDDTLGKRDDVKVVDYVYGDFTTPTALTKVQDLLSAHPEITSFISANSDSTRGVVQAVKQAGLQDKIKIYDLGAAEYSISAVEKGDVVLTAPQDPVGAGTSAAKALVDAFKGVAVPHNIDTFPEFTGGSYKAPLIIDSSNVKDYSAQY